MLTTHGRLPHLLAQRAGAQGVDGHLNGLPCLGGHAGWQLQDLCLRAEALRAAGTAARTPHGAQRHLGAARPAARGAALPPPLLQLPLLLVAASRWVQGLEQLPHARRQARHL